MGNRDRKSKRGVRMAASKGISLIVCALFLALGISACGSNEAANNFNALSGDIGQLQNNLSSKISEAETTLSGTKAEELADSAVLDQLKSQIDAAKSLSVDIPAMASDKSAIAQQVDDLTTLQDKLQKQYDSLSSAVSAIAASKQSLASSNAATKTPTTTTGNIAGTNDWFYKNGMGYSYTLTVTIYKPIMHAEAGETVHPGRTSEKLESSYFNPLTDIVVPASFKITNTTEGFEISPSMEGNLSPNQSRFSFNSPDNVSIERISSNGHTDDGDTYILCSWSSNLASGKSGIGYCFYIIHDYYSPNIPQGDEGLLNNITFWPIPHSGDINYPSDSVYIEKSLTDTGITIRNICAGGGYSSSHVGITLSGEVVNTPPSK